MLRVKQITVPELVRIEPRLAKFADFPTRLDFLLDEFERKGQHG